MRPQRFENDSLGVIDGFRTGPLQANVELVVGPHELDVAAEQVALAQRLKHFVVVHDAGVAAVDDEKHRFYWEGMPVWGKLRDHAELFAIQRACVVASTYCNSWIFEPMGESDPFEGMARSYTELFIVRSEDYKEKYLQRMFADYGIDGIIYHDAPGGMDWLYRAALAGSEEARTECLSEVAAGRWLPPGGRESPLLVDSEGDVTRPEPADPTGPRPPKRP